MAAEGDVIPVGGLLGVIADATVPDEEIDAFVAEFEASFVPGESEEDAGPAPETVEVAAGALRFLAPGRGRRAGRAPARLRRRPQQLASSTPSAGRRAPAIALDLPGHGGSAKDVGGGDLDAPRSRSSSTRAGSSARTSSGTRWAAWCRARSPLRAPDRVLSLALIAPAGLGAEINREYIDGFVARESAARAQAGAAAAVRRPGAGQRARWSTTS